MTRDEREQLDELKRWLFGEDGTGGSIGEIRGDVKRLNSDMAFIKGAVKVGVFIATFIGGSGLLWLGSQVAATVVNAAK